MTRLIALVDGSVYAESVCDHAGWVAGRTDASVALMHVLGRRAIASAPANLSGNLTLGARSTLLEELTRHDEEAARLARQRGRIILDAATERLQRDGVKGVTARLRTGDLLDALQEVEAEIDLIVLGKRGEAADFARLHPGSNLERVVRAASKPVLVASRSFTAPDRALIAFDGGPSITKAIDHIATGRLFTGLPLHLLHAGIQTPRMEAALEAATRTLQTAGHTVTSAIEPGEPEAVISSSIRSGGFQLLVMGAYGHSRIRSLIIGSTTTGMIGSCPVPVMLFR